MGQFASRGRAHARRDAEGDADYSYPPPSGLYFGNFFTMGGEEFSTMNPEAYLFGDMHDLNLLARVPGSPHVVPQNVQHVTPIRSLVNVHRDSLRLVRHAEQREVLDEYHIEFFFDADAPCAVTVYLFATESFDKSGNSVFASKNRILTSPTFNYEPGMNIFYSHPDVTLSGLAKMPREDLFFGENAAAVENLRFPVIIHVQARGGSTALPSSPTSRAPSSPPHSHPPAANTPWAASSSASSSTEDSVSYAHSLTTYATFEQSGTDGPFTIKTMVQKLNVDGIVYVLKEIYGLEKKRANEEEQTASGGGAEADTAEDDNTECVVCMSEARDTMVLPCRHLCLCNPCAEVLRFQANKCPICRATFHSLLQIRVLQKNSEEEGGDGGNNRPVTEEDETVPPHFSSLSVVDALRGTALSTQTSMTSASSAQQAPPPALSSAAVSSVPAATAVSISAPSQHTSSSTSSPSPSSSSPSSSTAAAASLNSHLAASASSATQREESAERKDEDIGYLDVDDGIRHGSEAYVEVLSDDKSHNRVIDFAKNNNSANTITSREERPLPIRDASSEEDTLYDFPLPGTPESTPRNSNADCSVSRVTLSSINIPDF